MLKLLALSLMLVLVSGSRYEVVNLFSKRSQGALEYRTVDLYTFKGIPNFSSLASDEKREIFHYEATVAVRDSAKDNGKVRRCEVFEVYKKDEAKEVLSKLKKLMNIDPTEILMDKMMALLKECDSVDDTIKQESDSESESESETETEATTSDSSAGEERILNGIVPGTNWCGFGDTAESYHDLGRLRNIDRCCRSHDLCPIKVLAKDENYNLTNKAIYTKSHCRCDEAFYSCLKQDNSWTGRLIGNLYFYVARPECIKGVPEKPEEAMVFVPATKKW